MKHSFTLRSALATLVILTLSRLSTNVQASEGEFAVGDVQRSGPFLLEYVGPAHQPTADEALQLPNVESDDPGVETASLLKSGVADSVFTAEVVDAEGRQWRVIDVLPEEVDSLVHAYDRARNAPTWDALLQEAQLPLGGGETAGPPMALASSDWDIFDCPQSSKWRYLPGSESNINSIDVSTTERAAIGDGTNVAGSFVVVGVDLVLTAGHVNVVTSPPASRSRICIRNPAGVLECRNAIGSFQNGTSGCDSDWELIRVDAAFATVPQDFDLASGSDSYLEDQTPRIAGYPTLVLGGESSCTSNSFMEGERGIGEWQSVKNQHLRLKITAGGNNSGSPYYFFHNSQGRYKVMGIHRGRINPVVGSRYACGPKVPFWRSTIIAAGASLGGTF